MKETSCWYNSRPTRLICHDPFLNLLLEYLWFFLTSPCISWKSSHGHFLSFYFTPCLYILSEILLRGKDLGSYRNLPRTFVYMMKLGVAISHASSPPVECFGDMICDHDQGRRPDKQSCMPAAASTSATLSWFRSPLRGRTPKGMYCFVDPCVSI